jgi:HD-like signal output (HDOD) protein
VIASPLVACSKSTKLPAGQEQADRIRIASVRDTDLPTMSDTMTKALSVINNPEAVLADLITVIQRDGALATAVLKLANSPVFMRQRTVDRVNQAIVILGMKTCKQVITSIWMRSTFSAVNPQLRKRCDLICKHSFLAASLATSINQLLSLGYLGEEFSAALLHDLGRLLIAVVAPDLFPTADPLTFREDTTILDHEHSVLGLDHCSLGGAYANRFNLPQSISSGIEFHHSPSQAGALAPLVAVVSAADHLANHILAEKKIKNYDPSASEGWRLLCPGKEPASLPNFSARLAKMVVKAMREARAFLSMQKN